ncbi:heterokaryon incompatibility protein-domain-containing protein [Dactylonectria estremocensis]|uniref:Heterokaryon incompatibility protein-domain-containing protein n=1 Tax=Dactylonectria estremocensis TaxID=1079267 RepID=A0A9P9FGC8_9HYPO|nr:heterokaryon incompatibility protein-domain-containing protein [Dactylonectria estremocensis]
MRLIDTVTLQLESFIGEAVPNYAILSHTWGEEEVLFEDICNGGNALRNCTKTGVQKVMASCNKAREAGYTYIWIDTCCIDKSSSAELSEAINSMFAWYRDAMVCYVYLADFDAVQGVDSESFRGSRWFRRGWTLQELLAPPYIEFYDCEWVFISDRFDLATRTNRITGIEVRALRRHHDAKNPCRDERVDKSRTQCLRCGCFINVRDTLDSFSIATRMSWASQRATTRREDVAYCLLGIFNINMPLLYGEGDRSFRRLQEEIIKYSDDQSILTWEWPVKWTRAPPSALAEHPRSFENLYRPVTRLLDNYSVTMSGGSHIEVDVLLGEWTSTHRNIGGSMAVLNCSAIDDPMICPVIFLDETSFGSGLYHRSHVLGYKIFEISPDSTEIRMEEAKGVDQYLKVTFDPSKLEKTRIRFQISSAARPTLETTPPVRVKLVDQTGQYALRHSVPEVGRDSLPRNIIGFWTDRCSVEPYRADLIGAHCFTNGRDNGFFVLWDLRIDVAAAHFSYTGPWWERRAYIASCSVFKWTAVAGRAYDVRNQDLLLQEEFYTGFLVEMYPSNGKKTQAVESSIRIDSQTKASASVNLVEFLGRKCFELVVEVEEHNLP